MSAPNPNGPAIPRPSAGTSELLNPSNSLPAVWIGSCAAMAGVATLFVALRFFVKAHALKQYNLADALCLLAWVFLIAYLSVELEQLNNGVGQHGWDITLAEYSDFAQGINQVQILYMPAIFFVKATILIQFRDFFVARQRGPRWWIIWTIIVANAVFFTILLFLEIFECLPREKIWDPMLPGHCLDINQTFVATATINVLDDFLILLLPLFWIWKLHMRATRKVGIAAVFAAGLFILRLTESVAALASPDITYSLVPIALWASAELTMGIIVACLPFLRRLFGASRDPNSEVKGVSSDYSSGAKSGGITSSGTQKTRSEGTNDVDMMILGRGSMAGAGAAPLSLMELSPKPKPEPAPEHPPPPVSIFNPHEQPTEIRNPHDVEEGGLVGENLQHPPAGYQRVEIRQSVGKDIKDMSWDTKRNDL